MRIDTDEETLLSVDQRFALWRERILRVVYTVMIVAGLPAYLLGIYAALNNGMFANAAVYTAVYITLAVLAFRRTLPLSLRIYGGLGIFLLLASVAFLKVGPTGSGRVWFFAFTIATTVFLGLRKGLAAVGAGALLFLLLGWHFSVRPPAWPSGAAFLPDEWFATGATFLLVEILSVFSVGCLISLLIQQLNRENALTEELRHSLDDREMLLKEVHHRVRNNLQVISSLLTLQTDTTLSPEAQAALRESRQRILAMASIHNLLYQNPSFSSIDMDRFVDELVQRLRQSRLGPQQHISVTRRIDTASVPVGIAVPCGLILNELVSNAFRHAFAERTEGQIRISLLEEGDSYILEIRDNGRGFPEEGFEEHLGLTIVHALAEQLRGTVHLYSEEGAEVHIAFPRADQQRPTHLRQPAP